jgi:predicted MFS family arabinose efflux permease
VVLSWTGSLTVMSLVALSFAGGVGAALMGPTWQAVVPELEPARDLRNAITLNSLGINIARSIGPAAGGLLLAAAGAAATYSIDVLSYLVVIAALVWWRRPPDTEDALSERFVGAFRAGIRYAKASRALHVVLLRAAMYFAFASAVWALLPLIARNQLGGDAGFYGILLGAVGAGAILCALVLPRLRLLGNADALLCAASCVTAVVTGALALAPPRWAALVMLILLGAAWIVALTTLNGAAQAILPNWVRGCGLAVYFTIFNGAMTGGTIGWGLVAQAIGVPGALAVSAALFILAVLVLSRLRLPVGDADLVPSNQWPEPLTANPVSNDRGPVLVLIEYRIAIGSRAQFLRALGALAEARRRDGAYSWGITEDAFDPERLIEWFMVKSWAEHLRQHKRFSHADADLQAEAVRFQAGPDPPRVRHFLALRPPRHGDIGTGPQRSRRTRPTGEREAE